MKVLFVIGKLEYSGAENVLRSITPVLQKYSDTDIMIALRFDDKRKDYNGIPVYFYGGGQLDRIRKLNTIVIDNNVDIIVSFGFPYNLDCSILKLISSKRKVILCERHDPSRIQRTKKQKIGKKLLYPLVDGYVVQTHKTKEYYLKHYCKPSHLISVIPNPVRNNDLVIHKERELSKEIVTVGRYDDAQKNHTLLIRAFDRFHRDHPDYILRLYGEGPDRKKYEELIAELNLEKAVYLMGQTNNPLQAIMNAEIFCLSSNYEGMPNALIEAMSIGKACVSTKCGGGAAEELISNGENGLLVPLSDEMSLANAFTLLTSDRLLRNSIEKNAMNINETLSLGKVVEGWHAFLGEIYRL